jgi:thymidylate synthase
MPCLQCKTTHEAWKKALDYIDRFGDDVKTEDGHLTRESQNLVITIKNPLEGYPIEGSGWGMTALNIYAEQFDDPLTRGFDYTYGERLHKCNQLQHAVDRLKSNHACRRAVVKTWEPCRDFEAEHTPCLQILDFLIRGEKLHMTAVFRSHDIGRAYVSNVYGLGKLQARIATELGIEIGTLTTVSISAHIYKE